MPTPDDNSASATKIALAKIRELKQKLAEAESAGSNEPIAIVSTACRFPSESNTPEAFWQSLVDERDETSELPEDRWDLDAYYDEDPDAPGKMYARRGTFLKDIDEMDADFFGISPREATWIDPQQRIFLEVSWEAMERAGWTTEDTGKDTGVFVGWMHNDYQNEASESLLDLNPYIATGSAGSFLCGRLSYYLGIQGPSLAIDTACSSSLVALHLACQSLRQGECDRALAGGVNVMVSPKTTIMTCKLHALSPSGRSRAFDASADGYLRGEGCGVVALRRLSDARRDGDEVLAVITGSAITHNGFSSGLTAPNPDSQQRVIRKALDKAGLKPSDVDYLEAHGTGTELGDPIEMNAAATVLGEGREKSDPLLVGSVKTNLGHLEAAAGIAGIIKAVLAIQHGEIPAHLHFETPNPHIAWDRLPVEVVTKMRAWPASKDATDDRRIAGVSAFGMSGTNAHIVVESAPNEATSSKVEEEATSPRATQLLPLSGKTEEAVRDLAGRYHEYLAANSGTDLAALCYSAAISRRHFENRAALVVDSREAASNLLSTLAAGGDHTDLIQGQAFPKPVVAWQFTGQGSQYEGMGKELYESEPVFRKALDDCAAELSQYREGDLLEIIFQDGDSLGETTWTQPALFSIHIALAELMKSWGMKPDIVLGHSLGQYAAACVAGMLDWKEGMRLIHERSRLTGSLPAGGGMAAVFADGSELEEVIESHQGLSIAARNGSHTVISGPEESVDSAIKALDEKGIGSKKLNTSHAFHSELLDPILDEFEKIADSIEYRPSECPLICNVSGEALPADQILDGAYWRRQLREAVQYESSVKGLATLGCQVMIELGPLPILTGMAAAGWQGAPTALISTLRKDVEDSHAMIESVGRLYQNGVNPDFVALSGGAGGKGKLSLPTYPFQRQRHWGPERPGAMRVKKLTKHPLLGEERALAGVLNERRYEGWVAPDQQHWLGDHRVFGDIIFPGAGYVEMAVAATRGFGVIGNLTFEMPMVVQDSLSVQSVIRGTRQEGTMEIYSSAGEGEPWVRHMTASLGEADDSQIPRSVSRAELEQLCPEIVEPGTLYEMFDQLGIQYGTEFQTIKAIRHGESEVLAKLELSGDHLGFTLPPMLLDGALHSMAVGLLKDPDSSLFLPVGIEKYHSYGPVTGELWSYGKWNDQDGEFRTADITLFDGTGKVVAHVGNLQVRAVTRAALRQMVGSSADRLLYNVQWRKVALPPATDRPGTLVVAGQDKAWNQELAECLSRMGQRVISVELKSGKGSPKSPKWKKDHAVIDALSLEHWESLFAHYFPEETEEPLNGVVWNTGEESDDYAAYTRTHCEGILGALKGLRAQKIEWLERGFQIVTDHAFSFGESEEVHPHSSQFWGMGRVIGNEYPALRCRIIDLHDGDEKFDDLISVLLMEARESQVAIRPGETFVPRIVHAKAPVTGEGLPVTSEGTYLITGGLGNLGRRAGEWLASKGAGHVVLVSRREPTDSTKAMIAEMEATGTKIHVMLADIGERKSLEALFAKMAEELPPLKGVIHAAGVLQDGLLVEQTWEGFEKVFAPKKGGAMMLDELTRPMELDFFVLYSSAASVMGSPGQANYATANAFLDALAHKRTAEGLPALSLNFGPWDEGMAATETVMKSVAFQGITALTADEAHEAVDRLIDNGEIQATMLDVDWGKMRQRYPVDAPPILDELWPDSDRVQAGNAVLLEKLREADKNGEPREEVFRAHVEEELQQILSLPEPPGADVPLAELGLDSLMAVEFSTRMQQQIGGQYAVAPTMAFDYPSVSKLTQHLMELIDAVPGAEETGTVQISSNDESIAIVGLGCRFPGADGPDAYWDLLQKGIDATREVPEGRWDVERFYSPDPQSGKMYTNRGGYLPDIGEFDAEFFGLSEQDAAWMDPQHRMLLETSWQALEDSGTVPDQMEDRQVGVFMGIMSTDYAQLREQMDPHMIEGSQGAGLSHSAGVGRISYMFGFEGPSIAVDTASSSSLVAVCQAVRSLLEGDCNLALAGGVNAILSPTNSLLLSKGGVLSPDGRSKSFSAKADGFGRGEGCGVVILKRKSDAERDGDRILGLIRGTAITHNGQNGGLTAPSGPSQKQMIRKALVNAGIGANEVNYLEAHATGTELGDPIEINAAVEVLGEGRTAENELLIGSAKANLSHLEAAGGISGLIKVVLSMQHGVIPRQIHFDEPSPHVAWEKIHAKVVTEETAWPNPGRPVAGVSALGMTGTNAHVILEGLPAVVVPAIDSDEAESGNHLLVISGKTGKGLQDLAQRYAERLLSVGDPSEFAAICRGSGSGRRHFEHRIALVTSSPEDAREGLNSFCKGKTDTSVFVGKKGKTPKIVWAFTGEDSQIPRGIRELYQREPIVKVILDQCSESLKDSLDSSLIESILDSENPIGETSLAVPALFAIQMALAGLWRSWGVDADLVVGDGFGQYAAACAAGMLSWDAGLQLAAKRGSLTGGKSGKLSKSELDELEEFAATLESGPAERLFIDSVTGDSLSPHASLSAADWRTHGEGGASSKKVGAFLASAEGDFVIEIGTPSKVTAQWAKAGGLGTGKTLPCFSGEGDSTLLSSLAKLYVSGHDPKFKEVGNSGRITKTRIPTYPFQRKHYWISNGKNGSS